MVLRWKHLDQGMGDESVSLASDPNPFAAFDADDYR
jgi:hypothetical protein